MDRKSRLGLHADRIVAAVLAVAGGVALVLGYVGTSGTALVAEQLPYVVSGGIGGLFLLGAGATLWLSADLHDEWQSLDDIRRGLADAAARDDAIARDAGPVLGDAAVGVNGHTPADDTVARTLGAGSQR